MPKSELHRRKMADKKSKRQPQDEPTPVIDSSSEDDEPGPRQQRGQKKSKGIKWKYVAFLALLFGSAILPAVDRGPRGRTTRHRHNESDWRVHSQNGPHTHAQR